MLPHVCQRGRRKQGGFRLDEGARLPNAVTRVAGCGGAESSHMCSRGGLFDMSGVTVSLSLSLRLPRPVIS